MHRYITSNQSEGKYRGVTGTFRATRETKEKAWGVAHKQSDEAGAREREEHRGQALKVESEKGEGGGEGTVGRRMACATSSR